MASRRVAAIRQGDLGVDRKQAQVQALPDIDLYSRWGICALLGPGGVASSVHDRILGCIPDMWHTAAARWRWTFQGRMVIGCAASGEESWLDM
ncbi:hypothetical protein EJB05_14360 [Eragrostis curvula]|uniref:Uncharacterized protein n=1 Tax=Eragrostis curvula TaxID=38414 RepID=A0A5J9VXB4_9POAL|nr:hypothetical protein EJB05_14360 [Eragrostis curvula]